MLGFWACICWLAKRAPSVFDSTEIEADQRAPVAAMSLDSSEAMEGGAEFVHSEAPITRGLLREAGLSLLPLQGARWSVEQGAFSRNGLPDPHTAQPRPVGLR